MRVCERASVRTCERASARQARLRARGRVWSRLRRSMAALGSEAAPDDRGALSERRRRPPVVSSRHQVKAHRDGARSRRVESTLLGLVSARHLASPSRSRPPRADRREQLTSAREPPSSSARQRTRSRSLAAPTPSILRGDFLELAPRRRRSTSGAPPPLEGHAEFVCLFDQPGVDRSGFTTTEVDGPRRPAATHGSRCSVGATRLSAEQAAHHLVPVQSFRNRRSLRPLDRPDIRKRRCSPARQADVRCSGPGLRSPA